MRQVNSQSKGQYRTMMAKRYQSASAQEKPALLDAFCSSTNYHRKYAIAVLNRPLDEASKARGRRRRTRVYDSSFEVVLTQLWRAMGFPWSCRFKAALPLWLPKASRHIRGLTADMQSKLLKASPSTIDRCLRDKRRKLSRRMYGRTKPGLLLKHQIPIQTTSWDVKHPGYVEIDLVSHSGSSANGEFGYSLNVTDIATGWVETRAVLGRGEAGIVKMLDEIRTALPFELIAIDSDNGSEFINHHFVRYCKEHKLAFTRSRPNHKNDNAHIEQKNWTHVRKIVGYERHDQAESIATLNDLYRNELRHHMNLFQPSVQLASKIRTGAKVLRRYTCPQTPLDRLVASYPKGKLPKKVKALVALRETLDPFAQSTAIDDKLHALHRASRNTTPDEHFALSHQYGSPRGAGS